MFNSFTLLKKDVVIMLGTDVTDEEMERGDYG